jgi:hypothetical protein
MPDKWEVVAEPVGANPGVKASAKSRARKTGSDDDKDKKDNVGGVVVFVARGGKKEEVARVGFVRETSENPKVPFKKKLDEVLDVAHQTADTLNDLVPDGDLQ